MSEFKFNCPHCQQALEAPEDMLGAVIDCPACQKQMAIPQPTIPAPVQRPVSGPPVPPPATPVKESPLAKVSGLWRSGAKGKAIIIGSALVILVIIGSFSEKDENTPDIASGSSGLDDATSVAPSPQAFKDEESAFEDEESAIKKELATIVADAPVRQVKEYTLDFPDAPFTIGKANERWQQVMKKAQTALDSGKPYDVKEAIRELQNEFKWKYYYDERGRTQQHDAAGMQNKQKIYGEVIAFLQPIYEQWETEQKQLEALKLRVWEADRDANKMLALVTEFNTALEGTSCPYKKSEVRCFLSNENFPFWQYPWMIRIKANELKKEQWASDAKRQQIEATYIKFKRQRPERKDIKDVIFNPSKYKGKVIISRVYMAGPLPHFCPTLTSDSAMSLDCPNELWDKLDRAYSAAGDYSVVKIKYWCNGSENSMSLGVLLDIEI